jgi:hypothetical protein
VRVELLRILHAVGLSRPLLCLRHRVPPWSNTIAPPQTGRHGDATRQRLRGCTDAAAAVGEHRRRGFVEGGPRRASRDGLRITCGGIHGLLLAWSSYLTYDVRVMRGDGPAASRQG